MGGEERRGPGEERGLGMSRGSCVWDKDLARFRTVVSPGSLRDIVLWHHPL